MKFDRDMRLLVIEDYEPLRSSLVQGLREAGFAVDQTDNGEEGLWYALGEEYAAIVLDLMIPKLDGLQVLERLRAQGKETHVLILTARDALEDRVKGLDLGADDYLTKPFAFAELLARIKALVRRRYGAKSPIIKVASLEIDRSKCRVSFAGQELPLTARQFALLEFFALNTGVCLSRAQLWDNLYDFAAEANSNLIEVYVSQLRRILSRAGSQPLIHTKRGLGYIFEARS